MGHSRLSPSSAERWMTCPASVEFCKNIPDTTSPYAQEGTNAHYLLELSVSQGKNPNEWLEATLIEPGSGTEFVVDQEMVDAVYVVFNLIKQRYDANVANGGTHFKVHSEMKVFPVRMGRFDTEGTCDVFIETDSYYENIDYKHGAGVPVEIHGNRQLQMYGIGAMDTLGLDGNKPLVTTIVQPRAQHPEGVIRSVIYHPLDIIDFTEELTEGANRTDDPNAPFNPVDKYEVCGWCRGKAFINEKGEADGCKALADKALQSAQAVFSDISGTNTSEIQANVLREPDTLTLDQVRMILENASLITGWVSAVQTFAKKQMESGVSIPGFKLIAGRGSRKWDMPDEDLESLLRSMKRTDRKKVTIDDVYSRSLRTPSNMEKTLKPLLSESNWSKVKEHIKTVPGAPALAPESSSKPALTVKADEVFKDISTPAAELPSFLQ